MRRLQFLKFGVTIILLNLVCSSATRCLAAEEGAIEAAGVINVEPRSAPSGREYLIFHSRSCRIGFELQRPSRKDKRILLCIPAAFTSKSGGLCGFYACRGELGNVNAVDRGIGGGIQFDAGKCRIFDTKNGADLDAAFAVQLKANKSSFFQQFQIVKDGHAESFKDKSRLQRRCIALLPNSELDIIESQDNVSFQEFGEDLVAIGAENAIYTDMGPWSEGWYRDCETDKTVPIGNNSFMTDRQTNWVVIEKEKDKDRNKE